MKTTLGRVHTLFEGSFRDKKDNLHTSYITRERHQYCKSTARVRDLYKCDFVSRGPRSHQKNTRSILNICFVLGLDRRSKSYSPQMSKARRRVGSRNRRVKKQLKPCPIRFAHRGKRRRRRKRSLVHVRAAPCTKMQIDKLTTVYMPL